MPSCFIAHTQFASSLAIEMSTAMQAKQIRVEIDSDNMTPLAEKIRRGVEKSADRFLYYAGKFSGMIAGCDLFAIAVNFTELNNIAEICRPHRKKLVLAFCSNGHSVPPWLYDFSFVQWQGHLGQEQFFQDVTRISREKAQIRTKLEELSRNILTAFQEKNFFTLEECTADMAKIAGLDSIRMLRKLIDEDLANVAYELRTALAAQLDKMDDENFGLSLKELWQMAEHQDRPLVRLLAVQILSELARQRESIWSRLQLLHNDPEQAICKEIELFREYELPTLLKSAHLAKEQVNKEKQGEVVISNIQAGRDVQIKVHTWHFSLFGRG